MKDGYALSYPELSCYEFLVESCAGYGDSCAIKYYNRCISYNKLKDLIDSAARSLIALGVKKGEHIAVILPNLPQSVILFYAANRVGAVADMIHPLSACHELEFYIKHSGIRQVFAVDLMADKLLPVKDSIENLISVSPAEYMGILGKAFYPGKVRPGEQMMSFASFMKMGKHVDLDPVPLPEPGDDCALLYTGGTTGSPKGVILSSYNFNCCAIEALDSCGCIEPGDRILTVLPVFHGFGLGVCIHTALIAGAVTDLVPAFNVKRFADLVKKRRPDIIAGVPAMYGCLVEGWNRKESLSFIKCAISGGDSLPPKIQQEVNKLFSECGRGNTVRQGYGLAECLSGICLSPEGNMLENCLGKPYKDNVIRILDHETCEELPCNETGEIAISGPVNMKGYYNDPKATSDAFITAEDGRVFLRTGDMGYMDEEGFVFFKGRFKNIIVSNGYDIYPSVIEDVILRLSSVRECAVVGVPDEKRGQTARAYIVADQDADKDLLLKQIREALDAEVAAYAIPKDIRFKDSLPRTKVGKADVRKLAEED